jgi:hypothetical protein
MLLACEISMQAYYRPNDVIRPVNVLAPDRMSPNLTIHVQLWPVFIALPPR